MLRKFASLIGLTLWALTRTADFWISDRRSHSFWWLWTATAISWTVCIPLLRNLKRAEKDSPQSQIEKEYPSILVQLKKHIGPAEV